MKYLAEFIVILPVNILMAWWHSRLIKKERVIRHDLWALVYVASIAAGVYLVRQDLTMLHQVLVFGLACLFGRLAVFPIALNLWRGLGVDYVSTGTTSTVDKLEYRLFGKRAWVVDIVAGATTIILTFFI